MYLAYVVNHNVVCKHLVVNFLITVDASVIQQKLYHHETYQMPEVTSIGAS